LFLVRIEWLCAKRNFFSLTSLSIPWELEIQTHLVICSVCGSDGSSPSICLSRYLVICAVCKFFDLFIVSLLADKIVFIISLKKHWYQIRWKTSIHEIFWCWAVDTDIEIWSSKYLDVLWSNINLSKAVLCAVYFYS
jgi:hypothetical protein